MIPIIPITQVSIQIKLQKEEDHMKNKKIKDPYFNHHITSTMVFLQHKLPQINLQLVSIN